MTSSDESAAVAAAEAALREISNRDLNEVRSFAKPPLACLAAFEAVGVLIEPSKTNWEWTDDKKLLAGGSEEFLKRISTVDKDHLTKEQIARLAAILDRDECQPDVLSRISPFFQSLGKWLRAVHVYASARQ